MVEFAAAIEARSEHPIAQAIAEAGDAQLRVDTFENRPGFGVEGSVDGKQVVIGRRAMFSEVTAGLEQLAGEAEAKGHTAVFAGTGPVAQAALVVADKIKPTSTQAVAALKQQGLEVALVTGDHELTARSVAAAVGIERVHAAMFPDAKAAEIARLQNQGQRVAMVGDGINDAPALAQADVGIAMGNGTDIAMEAADLTILRGDLLVVVDAVLLARKTLATIKGNLFWAFAYNASAIPLAASGVLNPMIAAGAMGLSSLFVVTNSLRLRRFTPRQLR